MLAPDHPDGDLDGGEQGLEGRGVVLVELVVFLEVEPLSEVPASMLQVRLERILVHRLVRGSAEVRGHDGLQDRRRHGFVDVQVGLYVTGRRGDPGPQNDDVDQGDTAERDVLKQVGAQRDRVADVVARDGRLLQASMSSARSRAWAAIETSSPSLRSDSPKPSKSKM